MQNRFKVLVLSFIMLTGISISVQAQSPSAEVYPQKFSGQNIRGLSSNVTGFSYKVIQINNTGLAVYYNKSGKQTGTYKQVAVFDQVTKLKNRPRAIPHSNPTQVEIETVNAEKFLLTLCRKEANLTPQKK